MSKNSKLPTADIAFPVPIYPGQVFVYKDVKQADAAMAHLGVERNHAPGVVVANLCGFMKAFTHTGTGLRLYIIGWFDERFSSFIHELNHAGFAILAHVGVDVTEGNNEAFCYLVDEMLVRSKVFTPDSLNADGTPRTGKVRRMVIGDLL